MKIFHEPATQVAVVKECGRVFARAESKYLSTCCGSGVIPDEDGYVYLVFFIFFYF